MGIVHIVLFEFKPTTSHAQIEHTCEQFIALGEKCIHPTTNKPYVKSIKGGRDNSPEGHQGGFSHGFVVEFESEEDRKYYLESDPSHVQFAKDVGPIVQHIRVVDFEPGKF